MSIFKNVLRITSRHPVYLVVYVVALSMMGLFAGLASAGPGSNADEAGNSALYQAFDRPVAVIDRDGSEVSRALRGYLDDSYELADVVDEPFALQDALAQGDAAAVLIVPKGYGERLVVAARAGESLPELDIASGFSPQAGALLSQSAGRWASMVAAAAALERDASVSQVIDKVRGVQDERAQVEVERADGGTSVDGLMTFFKFSGYSIASSIVVCAGVSLVALGEEEVRRRGACAPIALWRQAMQQIAGCSVVSVGVWAWTCALGLVAFGDAIGQVGAARFAIAAAALLAFALVPLAIAFLLTRLRLGETGLNACGNIAGMVMSFLGGAWVPLSLVGESVRAAARFSPAFWTNEAVSTALGGSGALDAAGLGACAADIGVVLLFAVAISAVGLAVGKALQRTAW